MSFALILKDSIEREVVNAVSMQRDCDCLKSLQIEVLILDLDSDCASQNSLWRHKTKHTVGRHMNILYADSRFARWHLKLDGISRSNRAHDIMTKLTPKSSQASLCASSERHIHRNGRECPVLTWRWGFQRHLTRSCVWQIVAKCSQCVIQTMLLQEWTLEADWPKTCSWYSSTHRSVVLTNSRYCKGMYLNLLVLFMHNAGSILHVQAQNHTYKCLHSLLETRKLAPANK